MSNIKNSFSRILVVGYYNRGNLGDDAYQGIMGKFFPDAKLEFIDSEQLTEVIPENYDALIAGGGDIINVYFHKNIRPFFNKFKGPKIAFSVGIPFPSLIKDEYLGYFDHVFTRNYEDVREIQKLLGSHRAHFIPEITLGYFPTYPHINETNESSSENKTCGIFLIGNLIKYPFIVNDIVHLISKISLTYNIIFYCFNPAEDLNISETIKELAYKRLNESISNNEHLFQLLEGARSNNRMKIDSNEYNAQEMIDIISDLNFAICLRYHSHVFCAVAGTPFVSISSTRKTRSFMKQAGLSSYQYEIVLNDNGTPIASDYEIMKNTTRRAIQDKILISEQLNTYIAQSKFLLINLQASRLLRIGSTDIRTGIANVIKETGDHQNAARLLSSYIIGYPDSPYVWGMYENFKNVDSHKESITNAIHDSFQYLTHHGAIIKNKLKEISGGHENLPLFVDIREYQSYKEAHRGGWYMVCENLYKLNSKNEHGEPNGIICDMYVDRTFHWVKTYMIYKGIIPYTGPWCGFIHHTANTTYSEYNTAALFDIPEFIQSLHTCLALFTLSEHLSRYLRCRLSLIAPHIKVITFAHPVVEPSRSFSFHSYKHNNHRKLINIGSWMRNPFTIYTIEKSPLDLAVLVGKNMDDHLPPKNFKIAGLEGQFISYEINHKYHNTHHPCRPESDNIPRWVHMLMEWLIKLGISISHYNNNILYIKDADRVNELNNKISNMIKGVTQIPYQSNDDYDNLLAHNVIFLDLIDAAAVNTIIECIVRRTPIVVNKIPGTIALLGEYYPLFYKDISEIPNLLTDKNIHIAHKYLRKLDIKRYRMKYFLNQIKEIITELL